MCERELVGIYHVVNLTICTKQLQSSSEVQIFGVTSVYILQGKLFTFAEVYAFHIAV